MRFKFFLLLLILLSIVSVIVMAGIIVPTSDVAPIGYTLRDIDNLISNNTTSVEADHSLSTTSVPVYSGDPSISTIYTKLYNLIEGSDYLRPGITYLGVTGSSTSSSRRPTITVATSSFNPTGSISAQGYTLEDIYNLIYNSTTTTQTSGDHLLTVSDVPDASMYSIDTLYNDLVNLIQPGDLLESMTYLGVSGTYAPRPAGYALSFDGSNDYVSTNIEIPPAIDSTLSSYSGWFYNDGVGDTNINWSIFGSNASTLGEFHLAVYGNNTRLTFMESYYGGAIDDGPDTVNLTVSVGWHHVAIVKTGTELFDVYLDGVKVIDQVVRKADTVSYFNLGRRYGSSYYDTPIDEVAVFNRALSSTEVEQLYNNGLGLYGDVANPPFDDGLVAGYHFDEGFGQAIDDFSNNNFDGVNNSSADYYVEGIIPLP